MKLEEAVNRSQRQRSNALIKNGHVLSAAGIAVTRTETEGPGRMPRWSGEHNVLQED